MNGLVSDTGQNRHTARSLPHRRHGDIGIPAPDIDREDIDTVADPVADPMDDTVDMEAR
jgi:hypothetical protein